MIQDHEVLFYIEDLKTKFAKINPKEYYLSYSGGKDSHLLFWFIKEILHNTDIQIIGINTYMEHPEIFARMKKNCDRILVPSKKPSDIKREHGIPCFSKFQDEMIKRYQNGTRTPFLMERITGKQADGKETQFKLNNRARTLLLSGDLHKVSGDCCKWLKKKPAADYGKESGRKPILGVRGSESTMRKAQYNSCFTKDGKFTPLHDLPDDWMDAIYKYFNIEIPQVYKRISRTGCMGCPYGSFSGNTVLELELLPEFKRKFVIDYFRESYDVLGIDLNTQTIIDIDNIK